MNQIVVYNNAGQTTCLHGVRTRGSLITNQVGKTHQSETPSSRDDLSILCHVFHANKKNNKRKFLGSQYYDT